MKLTFCTLVLLMLPLAAAADATYVYHACTADAGEQIGTFTRHYRQMADNTLQCDIRWDNRESGAGRVGYVMDLAYATRSVHFQVPGEDTDYTCDRRSNRLHIQGRIKGKPVDRSVAIDSQPFYFNPSVGLQHLASAKTGSQDFWVLRPGDLAPYKMHAEVAGQDDIVINGERVRTIRIKWSLTGLLALFYSQNGWFREQDGVFLKSEVFEGEYFLLFSQNRSAGGE